MTAEETLKELRDLARKIGLHVHYDILKDRHVPISSGRYRLKGEVHVMLDRRLQPLEKARLLAAVLSEHDLAGHNLSDKARKMISQETGQEAQAIAV